MQPRQGKTAWQRPLLVLILAMAFYVLSFGPACWIVMRRGFRGERIVETVYHPVLLVWEHSQPDVRHWIKFYVNVGTGSHVLIVPRQGQLAYYESDHALLSW